MSSSQEQEDEESTFRPWELPYAILYHIVSFVAPSTHRAGILCNSIAILCEDAKRIILEEKQSVALWNAVLVGDYGVDPPPPPPPNGKRPKRQRTILCPHHRVRDYHLSAKDNSKTAYFRLSRMVHANSGKEALTKQKLQELLEEFCPVLINHRVPMGGHSRGAFLLEVCRATAKETVILKCVKELVGQRGANVNILASDPKECAMSALCVAAVRGMPTVVKYLLEHGASKEETTSGVFRLASNLRKTVRCEDVTPLEFAQAGYQKDLNNGARKRDLTNLNKCIRMLEGEQG